MIHLLMLAMLLGQPKNKIIHWSEDRKLTMEDFQKVAHHRNTNEYSGQTWSGIEPEYHTDGYKLTYKVPALFNRDSSWMVYYDAKHSGDLDVEWMNRRAGTYGLSHEQKHFDITEVYARKIRKMFREEVSRGNIDRIDDRLERYFREWEECQDRYDSETQHSLNQPMQAKWDTRIQAMLDELSDYKEDEGEVILGQRRRS
ncbi:hypothetical protein [Nemorincola caseinilytica]